MEEFRLGNGMLHYGIDYTPYEGVEFSNWPRYTVLRGRVVWERNVRGLVGEKGDGEFVKRTRSSLPGPRELFVNEWRPPT